MQKIIIAATGASGSIYAKLLLKKMAQLENLAIPENFNYGKLVSLSNEARQKFIKIQPRTLGQASRISGVNPSDVQILMVYMGR